MRLSGNIGLLDLEPRLLCVTGERERIVTHDLSAADGIMFVCPQCLRDNNGNREGIHSVICWRPRVAADVLPGPGRWEFEGDSLENLSLVAASSSVLLTGGCRAHFFVERGKIRFT